MSTGFSSGGRFGGAFTLLRPLGSGGMAEVWLAREDDLDREVALKILHRATAAAREHFLAEAKSLAAVRHPGIVPILRFGVDEATNHPFFAMPVYSETLANRLDREGRLAETEVAELGMSLVSALATLHEAGIAHRDLKPSNILLDGEGPPVLADIGPADGGSPAWAAPEQLANNGASVPPSAADWHALGLLLYRALVGTLPPPRGILPAAVDPPRGMLPRDLHPRPSRGWERLLVVLLDPDPATRLTDPNEILRALRRLRRRAHRRAQLGRFRHPLWGVSVCLALALSLAFVFRPWMDRPQPSTKPPPPLPSPSEPETPQAPLKGLPVKLVPTGPSKKSLSGVDYTRQQANHIRKMLESPLVIPHPDASGQIIVTNGAVLLSGDIPSSPPLTIVLDGGTLRFSPGAEALREHMRLFEAFLATDGPDDRQGPAPPSGTVYFGCPITVTGAGGHLDTLNGNISVFATNTITAAAGTTNAPLRVLGGTTHIILDRSRIDPSIRLSGNYSTAVFYSNGHYRDHWFYNEDFHPGDLQIVIP